MTDTWLIDGELQTHVPIDDRGLAYGDGLFETMAVRAGAIRLLDYHLERLAEGCGRLALPVADYRAIGAEAERLAAGRRRGVIKVILTRGSGPRGYAISGTARVRRICGLFDAPEPDVDRYASGVKVRQCLTPVSISPALAGLKTLGRLEQVLARMEWADPDTAEGLMFDPEGRLVGGTMSNVFLVADGCLTTPSVRTAGVAGIMRRKVLETAADLGLDCRETQVTRDALLAAEEIFLSNSQFVIWPVREVGEHRPGPGPVTHRMMAALANEGIAEWPS